MNPFSTKKPQKTLAAAAAQFEWAGELAVPQEYKNLLQSYGFKNLHTLPDGRIGVDFAGQLEYRVLASLLSSGSIQEDPEAEDLDDDDGPSRKRTRADVKEEDDIDDCEDDEMKD